MRVSRVRLIYVDSVTRTCELPRVMKTDETPSQRAERARNRVDSAFRRLLDAMETARHHAHDLARWADDGGRAP